MAPIEEDEELREVKQDIAPEAVLDEIEQAPEGGTPGGQLRLPACLDRLSCG